jgi:hypothetical protein
MNSFPSIDSDEKCNAANDNRTSGTPRHLFSNAIECVLAIHFANFTCSRHEDLYGSLQNFRRAN